jgi:hypothetical protein
LLSLWLLKVILRCINDGVATTKPGHQINTQLETRAWYGQMSHPSCCFIHQEEFTFEWTPKEAWFQQWNTKEVLWWSEQQYRGTVFCWSLNYPSWPDYWKGVHGLVA